MSRPRRFFILAYRNYLEDARVAGGHWSRADGIAQRVAARIEAQRGAPITPEEAETLRLQARELAGDNDTHFAIERRRFFYIDESGERPALRLHHRGL